MLKEFDSTQTEYEWPNSELETQTSLIRTHENEIGCSFAEIDRENLYYNSKPFMISTTSINFKKHKQNEQII